MSRRVLRKRTSILFFFFFLPHIHPRTLIIVESKKEDQREREGAMGLKDVIKKARPAVMSR